ncbi:MAG: PaaI family thioesterase [Gemmatimonadota bacterium]|nr:PaaI family thioesterase [Gemmatimonadota bacterium]
MTVFDPTDAGARERLREELVGYFGRAPIVRTLGMELLYEDGRAAVRLPPNPDLSHPLAQVHGGMVGTIVDTAAWFDAAPHYGVWLSTSDYHVRLLEPIPEDVEIRAVANPVRLGRRTAVERVLVERDDGGVVAVGSATLITTSQELRLP